MENSVQLAPQVATPSEGANPISKQPHTRWYRLRSDGPVHRKFKVAQATADRSLVGEGPSRQRLCRAFLQQHLNTWPRQQAYEMHCDGPPMTIDGLEVCISQIDAPEIAAVTGLTERQAYRLTDQLCETGQMFEIAPAIPHLGISRTFVVLRQGVITKNMRDSGIWYFLRRSGVQLFTKAGDSIKLVVERLKFSFEMAKKITCHIQLNFPSRRRQAIFSAFTPPPPVGVYQRSETPDEIAARRESNLASAREALVVAQENLKAARTRFGALSVSPEEYKKRLRVVEQCTATLRSLELNQQW